MSYISFYFLADKKIVSLFKELLCLSSMIFRYELWDFLSHYKLMLFFSLLYKLLNQEWGVFP